MNTCIIYHSYLKEGYGANMDDEDWNTDLPLCSSTKMNQLFHSDIPVKQHKSHFWTEGAPAVQQSSTMYVNRGIKWWFIVCCPEKQTSKKHIWVGPIFVHSSHLLLCVDSKSSPGHTTVHSVTPIFPFSTKRPVGWPVCTTFTPFPSCLYQVRCTY